MPISSQKKRIGVIGAGSFGIAVSNLLSLNQDVFLYTRSQERADKLNLNKKTDKYPIADRVHVIASYEELCDGCNTIFPIVPSKHFRSTMKNCSPYLRPDHILIHGTKGLDIVGKKEEEFQNMQLSAKHVRRMSQVIVEETVVRRIGCLSGPNLAKEIHSGQPSASVVASEFDEVIQIGQKLLNSSAFFVFGSRDIIGAELAGSFKNIIALGSGMLAGMGMGKNLQALLITRALREIILLGKALGSSSRAFLGTAGIGDTIATSLSSDSRNYSVGYSFASGMTIEEIVQEMDEVAEGMRTILIAEAIARNYQIHVPIIDTIHRVLYRNLDIKRALNRLMKYPFAQDVDFL